jgi:hypothetical protein
MKNLFHLVTAARSRRAFFFKLNGENISGDGIILSDMEFGIHTLSRSHPLPLKIQLYTWLHFLCFWVPPIFARWHIYVEMLRTDVIGGIRDCGWTMCMEKR